jgi:hypothetical protein
VIVTAIIVASPFVIAAAIVIALCRAAADSGRTFATAERMPPLVPERPLWRVEADQPELSAMFAASYPSDLAQRS